MLTIELEDLASTERFAQSLSRILQNGDVLSLKGDLGVGKTTLSQMIGKALHVQSVMTSPTFGLVNTYYGDKTIHHLDLYRLERPEEIESIDFEEYFYPRGITLIEWADKASGYLPNDLIELVIMRTSPNSRSISILGKNQKEKRLIKELSNEGFGH